MVFIMWRFDGTGPIELLPQRPVKAPGEIRRGWVGKRGGAADVGHRERGHGCPVHKIARGLEVILEAAPALEQQLEVPVADRGGTELGWFGHRQELFRWHILKFLD